MSPERKRTFAESDSSRLLSFSAFTTDVRSSVGRTITARELAVTRLRKEGRGPEVNTVGEREYICGQRCGARILPR